MLLASVALFFAGAYFLRPGLAAALQKKPAVKPVGLKAVAAAWLFVVLAVNLPAVFVAFVKLYGSTVYGVHVGAEYAYAALGLLAAALGLYVYSAARRDRLSQTSLALAGVDPACALPALRGALQELGLDYQESLSRIALPALGLSVEIALRGHEIRFSTPRPLDKLFLGRLARAYREHYRRAGFPVPRRYVWLALLQGGACLAAALLLCIHWLSDKILLFP